MLGDRNQSERKDINAVIKQNIWDHKFYVPKFELHLWLKKSEILEKHLIDYLFGPIPILGKSVGEKTSPFC